MKFKNRLNRWDDGGRYIHVQVKHGASRPIEITVSQGISLRDSKPESVQINWPAVGACDPETASLMAEGLIQAATIAKLIEAIEEWKRPEHPGGKTRGAFIEFDADGKLVVNWVIVQE